MIYCATVYYRTKTQCKTWTTDVMSDDINLAIEQVRMMFERARPRAAKIDRIELVMPRVK